MNIDEKVKITDEHLATIREKWDCEGIDDETIIQAMLRYEKRSEGGSIWILEHICFPNFQSYLHFYKTKSTKT